MTEKEWLECADLDDLLRFLRKGSRNWIQRLVNYDPPEKEGSKRKTRLFACTCARRVPNIEDEACCREAIELSERYADGLVSDEALLAAEHAYPKEPDGWILCTPQNVRRPMPQHLLSQNPLFAVALARIYILTFRTHENGLTVTK